MPSGIEHIIAMCMFCLVCTLLSFFVAKHLEGSCAAKQSSAAMFQKTTIYVYIYIYVYTYIGLF